MPENDNIEFRSEKVISLLGKVPPCLVREGIGIITLILFLLGFVAFYVPCPESITAEVKVTSVDEWDIYAEAFIPYRFVDEVQKGMPVKIEFEGYDANKYGSVDATIQELKDTIISVNGENYFSAGVSVKSGTAYRILEKMKGSGSILISGESIIEHILNK